MCVCVCVCIGSVEGLRGARKLTSALKLSGFVDVSEVHKHTHTHTHTLCLCCSVGRSEQGL